MATRACSVCDVRREGCCLRSGNWRGWRATLMSCLPGGHCCCSCRCLSSSSTTPDGPATASSSMQEGPSSSTTPESSPLQGLGITIDQLEHIIPIIEQEVDRLDPNTASSSSHASISQSLSESLVDWDGKKQICTCFLNSLPKNLTDEVAGSLFMPLLTKALSGVGGLHWLGVGFTFIAWSLDNISNVVQNRVDCIGILRRSVCLLRSTKEIWQLTNIDNSKGHEDLQDSVEKAFRCAIFCTSTLTEGWILRILKATTVKDAIAVFAAELDRATNRNTQFIGIHQLRNENLKLERQITYDGFGDDDIVGGQDIIQEAVEYFKIDSDDRRAILLHGMGGIGKSFLGLKIFTKLQKSKYRDCRVELPFETTEKDLCDVKKQIVEKVSKHATSGFLNLTDAKQKMENELMQINDPILLYVDNVLEQQDLPKLLPKASVFPKGSRILITSRGDALKHGIHELGIKECMPIEVRKLQKQQAQQLLWKQLKSKGEHRDNNSEVESLEESVLERCDGLPLAITVVGKYIASYEDNGPDQKVKVWRQVVQDMERAEPIEGLEIDPLYHRIRFSMHNLIPNVKQAFLDTIFLDGFYGISWENIELLVSKKYLKVLCDRALVGKRDKKSSPQIHDVIKALGRRMLKDEEEELRICGEEEFEKHKNKNTLEKVVALVHVTVDAYLFQKMPLLRLLKNVEVRGECQENIELRQLRVVSGLRCSTTTVFDWSQCPSLKEVTWGDVDARMMIIAETRRQMQYAPNVCNLQEVFKHDMSSMGIEALALYGWSQLKDVDVIETLTCSLKELRLCYCKEIESLPEGISRLTGLNQLQLTGCAKLKGLPQGISRLTCLEVVNLKYCESLQNIPEGIARLTCLEVLDLSFCQSVQSLPDGLTSLTGLAELNLNDCKRLQNIPEGIGNLRGLTDLTFRGCESLESVPEGATNLMSGLTKLSLGYCKRIKYLPKGVTRLTGLTSLSLQGCKRLQALPEGIASLSGLINLDLMGCRSLQALPEKLGFMTGLVHLCLFGCESLQSIEGVTTLTALSYIGLSRCRSLKSIPEGLGHLSGVQYDVEYFSTIDSTCLNFSYCESLKSLPQSIASFTLLKELDLTNCTSLEYLPEGVTRLSKLAKLSLLGCTSLQCLPRGLIGSLTGLTKLELGECAMPIDQPLLEEVSCNMTRLKVLKLSECEDLQALPQGITTNLMSLQELSLSGCRNIQLLPQGMANWTGLTRLDLSGCQSIQSLPEELTTLTALSDLNLAKCACLQSLPQGLFTSLAGLEELSMSECGGLPLEESQGITMLTGLRSLDLSECEHVLFPLSEKRLARRLRGLRELNLSGCRSLQSLPEGLAALTNLHWLYLSGCASLQSLSNLPQGSTRLWELDLGGCGSLDQSSDKFAEVWETIFSFKRLYSLKLSGWETMKALPEGIASLESLLSLDLSKCSSLLSLPQSVTKLMDLRSLILAECKSLRSLGPEITRMVLLNELDLSGCTSLDQPLSEEFTNWISGIEYYRPCPQQESSPHSMQ